MCSVLSASHIQQIAGHFPRAVLSRALPCCSLITRSFASCANNRRTLARFVHTESGQKSAVSVQKWRQWRPISTSSRRDIILNIVDTDDFQERVILSAVPVIVNFHADWCEPCKELTPLLEEIVGDRTNIALCSLDIENHVRLLEDFEVLAVPAVLAFFNGQVVGKFVGLVNREVLVEFVDQSIDRLNKHAQIQRTQADLYKKDD